MTKVEYVGFQLKQALVEEDRFDLLAIGRQEGPGCYCYINSVLRGYLDALPDKYEYVLIDNEAGMEHLSRRTTRDVDHLFIVSDPAKTGILTAKRIVELSDSLDLKVNNKYLLINKITEFPEQLKSVIEECGFESYYLIPKDPKIEEFSWTGKPVIELPNDSIAFQSVSKIIDGLKL